MKVQTITTEDNIFRIEEDNAGWYPKYRLRLGDRVTEWGAYEDLLMLDKYVAVSPYHTHCSEYIICNATEALIHTAVLEKK